MRKYLIRESEQIDKLEADNQMTDLIHSKRIVLKSDLCNIELKQSQHWTQRAMKNWLDKGDENTAYFHKMCSTKPKEKSYIRD